MNQKSTKSQFVPILVVCAVIIALAGGYFFFNKKLISGPEKTRQEKVKAELALTVVEPVETDLIARLKKLSNVPNAEIALYRDGVKKLMEVAPIMQLLYQKQIGASPDDRIKAETADDRELFDRYGHPWCLSDSSKECVAIPSMPERTSTVIPEGITCEEANKVGSPFTVVSKNKDGKVVAIPYSEFWSEDYKKTAGLLKEAAAIFQKIPRESKFVAYLTDLSAAFESSEPFPYVKSDISWVDFINSDTLLFARIGPDEVYHDGVGDVCESRAQFHFNIGLKNQETGSTVETLRSMVDVFEKRFAELINDPQNYSARQVNVELPVFVDVMFRNGDDAGNPGGITVGQSLPNWCGADGKDNCKSGTMVYTNVLEKAYDEDLMKKYIMPLFDEKLTGLFSSGPNSVVYHEVFHNIGPQYSARKNGSDKTVGELLMTKAGVSWKMPLEELKAQTGSLFMAGELYKNAVQKNKKGDIDAAQLEKETEKFKKHVIYDMAWATRMILRGSKNGPEFQPKSTYSKLAAVQIGFLTEQGALKFDDSAKRWAIDFDKMPDAVTALASKVGQIYATANADEAENFFLYYIKGDGEKLLHRDRILESAAKMPSPLIDFKLKGL